MSTFAPHNCISAQPAKGFRTETLDLYRPGGVWMT